MRLPRLGLEPAERQEQPRGVFAPVARLDLHEKTVADGRRAGKFRQYSRPRAPGDYDSSPIAITYGKNHFRSMDRARKHATRAAVRVSCRQQHVRLPVAGGDGATTP